MKKRDILIALFVLTNIILLGVSYKLLSTYINPPGDPPKPEESQIYAGIEIGTKSVRFAIIEKTKKGINIRKQGQMFPENTDSLLDQKKAQIEPILLLVEKILNDIIIPAKISDNNIYIGLGSSYQKEEPGNFNSLKGKLETKYNTFKIETLDEKTECLVEMLSIIDPPGELEKLLVINIGSKSSKICIYTNSDSAFPNQTSGIDDLVEKTRLEIAKKQDFQRLTEKIRLTIKESVDNFINNNIFREKNIVIITGGIGLDILCQTQEIKNCQTITGKSYIETQSINNINDYTQITLKSLNNFREVLKKEYVKRNEFDAKYKSPYTRFNRENQLLGLEFTQLILEALNTSNNKNNKDVFFYERLTWMPGYINYKTK